MLLSVVLPCYNEESNLALLVEAFKNDLKDINYELIFVDDGSKDNSFNVLADLYNNNSNIQVVKFSRNFGKEAAVFCGLKQAKGDCVVVMDTDFQHPIVTINEMYKKWQEGYEVVEGVKVSRQKESFFNKFMANLFYKLLNNSSSMNLQNASDFKLLDRKVVDALNAINEKQTFFRALSSFVGFKTTFVYFEVKDRFSGDTKWNRKSLFVYAINNITSFSNGPMQLVTYCGILFFVFALILGVDTLYNYFFNNAADGFTTVILLLLIIGSILSFSLGVIGIYLAKIYEEVKGRPRYFISECLERNIECYEGKD